MTRLQSLSLSVLLLVVSLTALGAPLPEGLKQLANCRKEEGNLTLTVKGQEPLDLFVQSKDKKHAVLLTLAPNEIKAVDYSGKKTKKLEIARSYPATGAVSENPVYTIKFRDNEWSVFVDGALRALMPSVFAMPGTASATETLAARMEGGVKFLAVAKADFKTEFMIEEGAPNELYPWNIQTGTWRLHTALQQALIRPETDQASAKRAPLTADKSPNFYSLKGGGANVDNIITTGQNTLDNYSMTCSIQLEKGEGGIIFYHRDEIPVKAPDAKEEPKPDPAKAEFYAFTLRMNVPSQGQHEVRLWHQKNGVKRILARAEVPLYANQWYLPGIAAHGDEIICYLDHYELFRVTEPLPVGGKFGMFLNTPEETRMDDVTVKHFADIKLDTVDGVRFNTLYTNGSVSQGWWGLAHANGQKRPEIKLKDNALLALGRVQSQNRVFETTVEPSGKEWTVGLAAEWTEENVPSTRFSVSRKADGTETYTLFTYEEGKEPVVISTFDHALSAEEKAAKTMRLMMDATDKGKLRCFKDGKLVFFYDKGSDFIGANAIWTAKGTKAVFTELALNTERSVFKELKQKNPIFEKDSFMRHWASPEGQWIAGKASAYWHKGDFFTDFFISMPCIPNSDFSIGVADDKDDGPVIITVKDEKLVVSVKEFEDKDPVVTEVALKAPEGKGIDALDYVVHYEGYWLWIDLAGKTVHSQRLGKFLRTYGTKVRVKGMTIPHLARTKVTRTNVIDEFFNESPHDWLANGGDWQIINRFQCTPSWSHMIGEAHETMGAFWRKQIFKGDMTLEFYAGSRQGAYDEMGNLNCTIMAKDNTAHSGYTVACTEWDQNLSQNWTTLYKNGKVMTKTDKYLVPRSRKGLARKILDPLISEGRPYHGAWYYIKLRKIGDKIEYYFDNELIFTEHDGDMLQEGIVGIWTFIHSMTLAQIKITYDEVSPRPIPVTMLPAEEAKPLPEEDAFTWKATLNGFNVDSLARPFWTVNDKVGQSVISPFKTADGASAFTYTNRLGAGDMQALANGGATTVKLTEIAGWQIKVKRTADALFNVMYQVGTKNEKGEFTPVRNAFQRISGDDFTNGGQWRMTASTEVAPIAKLTAEDKDWTTVNVWIPSRFHFFGRGNAENQLVRFVGFGIEQRDAILNGIWGNGPNEAYAVGEITPVFYGAPLLTTEGDISYTVLANAADPQSVIAAANPQELQKKLNDNAKDGINTVTLQLSTGERKLSRTVAWIKLPEKLPLEVSWDNTVKDGIRVACTSNYPDPRFGMAPISCNGKQIRMRMDSQGEVRTFTLPREAATQEAVKAGKVTVTVAMGPKDDKPQTFELDTKAAKRQNSAPSLMKLNGFTPFFTAFEEGYSANLSNPKPPRLNIRTDSEDGQGQYLHVRNTAYGQALETVFSVNYSVAQYPVIQFRYKAWDMTQISLRLARSEYYDTRLTDSDSGSLHSNSTIPVRLGKNFTMDEKWHSWTGIVSDAFNGSALNSERFLPSYIRFGSVGGPDQTGRYSQWALDDLVAGPAAHTAEQLAFTPEYYDADGVSDVYVAYLEEDMPYHDHTAEQQAAVAWKRVAPGEKIIPETANLKQGIHHVLVKAKDSCGNESAVTDLPFLWDTTPLAPTFAVTGHNDTNFNGSSLNVTFNNSALTPLAVDKTKYILPQNQTLPEAWWWSSQFIHNAGAKTDTFIFNYPFIFRDLLDKSKDGDEFTFTLDGLVDGAGNAIPAYATKFKVNYAADKKGPNWFDFQFGSSVNSFFNWYGRYNNVSKMAPGQYNRTEYVNQPGGVGILVNHSYYGNGDATYSCNWNPNRFPCLSLRIAPNVVRGNATLHLILTTTDKAAYSISLVKPGGNGNELNLKQTFAWEAGKAKQLSFNLLDLLKERGVPQDKIAKTVFNSIRIQRRGQQHDDGLQIGTICIHGMPDDAAKPDFLTAVAFDASGVATLEATCVDENGKDLWTHSFENPRQADLNQLRAKFHGTSWFRCHAKDKAGNASPEVWIPVYNN